MYKRIASYALMAAMVGCSKDTPSGAITEVKQTTTPSFQTFGVYDITAGHHETSLEDKYDAPIGITSGDFDGDGKIDIAIIVKSAQLEKNQVIILRNEMPQKSLDTTLTPEKEK